ncbi:MAG: DNA methyltransferase [Patescibacteria group bacterium]
MQNKTLDSALRIQYIPVSEIKPAVYNPRKHTDEAAEHLRESIKRFGLVDPLVCNNAPGRENVLIGGHFRLKIAKEMGHKEVPVVYITIPDLEREKELNLRLNKNVGEFNLALLAEYDESFLKDIGFDSEDLDDIFAVEPQPEMFDLKHELAKLDINEVKVKKGDIFQLGDNRLMCGDSTLKEDVLKLMNGEKADMCFTDPPYQISYLKGKTRNGKPTEGFGYKRDRKYLETDVLPENFTELWMNNIAEVAKEDFHIIVFENWKNIRNIWDEMEKRWKVRNMLIYHLSNRTQGFAAKYKFFNKYDIAMVGSGGESKLNVDDEEELLQNEYETAVYATNGNPHWEPYKKGKRICPTDYVSFSAPDEKSTGQSVIFGTKPTEILAPYIKVLTKRGDLVVEPFAGSGSTLIAAQKLGRKCYLMEKVPAYVEVVKRRWEIETGRKAKLVNEK